MQQANINKLREENAKYLALTPTERFEIMCRKLDRIQAKVQSDPIVREKYLQYRAAKDHERKLFHEWWRRIGQTGSIHPPPEWERYPTLEELFPDI